MPGVTLVVPGRLTTRTGGYIYDRRIADGLGQRGWTVTVREIADSFPAPTAADLAEARAVLASAPDGSIVLIDGLAFSAMPSIVEAESARLRLVALVHLPRTSDPTVPPGQRPAVNADEGRALATAALVIVTGPRTVDMLGCYGLPADRIAVVSPGTDQPTATATQAPPDGPVRVLSVATLNGGKGHDILLDALAALPPATWRLVCAGSLTRDPATATTLRSQVDRLGIAGHVTFAGDLAPAALAREYARADVFALATLRETYGMAVAEALAHGLPVVSTRTGAIDRLVTPDAGMLVEPGDTSAFADAVARVVTDADLRTRLAAGARLAGAGLPSWADAAREMETALERLAQHG